PGLPRDAHPAAAGLIDRGWFAARRARRWLPWERCAVTRLEFSYRFLGQSCAVSSRRVGAGSPGPAGRRTEGLPVEVGSISARPRGFPEEFCISGPVLPLY